MFLQGIGTMEKSPRQTDKEKVDAFFRERGHPEAPGWSVLQKFFRGEYPRTPFSFAAFTFLGFVNLVGAFAAFLITKLFYETLLPVALLAGLLGVVLVVTALRIFRQILKW